MCATPLCKSLISSTTTSRKVRNRLMSKFRTTSRVTPKLYVVPEVKYLSPDVQTVS